MGRYPGEIGSPCSTKQNSTWPTPRLRYIRSLARDRGVAVPAVNSYVAASHAIDDLKAVAPKPTGLKALDGLLSVGLESRMLIEASLAQVRVKNDNQGSYRLVKCDPKTTSRAMMSPHQS